MELLPITYTNIQEFPDSDFREYLATPGFSHSFLKYEKDGVVEWKEITDKMRLGSLVDSLLTESSRLKITPENGHLYTAACEIASHLKHMYGDVIRRFRPQVNYTATMAMGGFEMPTKGRLDWELPRHSVHDLKVTNAKDEDAMRMLIKFMGYDNQLWHYCKMAGVTKGYIYAYSTTSKRPLAPLYIDCSSDTNAFWQGKILKFGSVKA